MEAIHAPAFLIRNVNVVHANALGRARLGTQLDATRKALDEAWASHPPAGVEVTRVRSAGTPDHALVILRATAADVGSRATALAERWGLTPRQREVLAWVARGSSNRDIGQRLGCAESTVELHVTAILRKAGCGSRTQLMAGFWSSCG
jgi:DNA-binding CsgD family transcriptional regulator